MKRLRNFWSVVLIGCLLLLWISWPPAAAPSLSVSFSHYAPTNGVTWGFIVISNSASRTLHFSGATRAGRSFLIATETKHGGTNQERWLAPYGAEGYVAGGGVGLLPVVVVQTNVDWRVQVRYGAAPLGYRLPRLVNVLPERWFRPSDTRVVWSSLIEKPHVQ